MIGERVPGKRAYTIEEAATAYSVSASFIRGAISRGELAAKRIGAESNGKRVLKVDELDRWFDTLPDA